MRIEDIDWSKFDFLARQGCWFIEGYKCICKEAHLEYGILTNVNKVEDNDGMFFGKTKRNYRGNFVLAISDDHELCAFREFDIYYNGEIVNEITYAQLFIKMRKNKIKKISND